jgi:tetratricopeptide (TPR) repeat protein
MTRLTFDEMSGLLPDVAELRPVLDQLLGESLPDDDRRWAGSGALGTAGDRFVDPASLRNAIEQLARAEHAHLDRTFRHVATAAEQLAVGDASGAARQFLELAALEEARDRGGRAAAYAGAACSLATGATDPALESLALRRLGRARLRAGDHPAAVADYRRAHEIAEAAGDVRGSAEAAIGAGNVLEEQGRWNEAETWYRRALQHLDNVDDPEGPAVEAWHAWLNLHVVMRSRGQLDESLDPLIRAEEIAASLDDDSAGVFIENARGQLCMARGDSGAAIEHFRWAVAIAGGARASVTVRLNLAEALLASGRSLEAAQEARHAEREAIIARIPQKLPGVYRLLGRVAVAEGDPDAFVLFERALEIINERELTPLERAITLQAYSQAERHVGERETSERLREMADQIYEELGIEHRRSQFADHYGSDEAHDADTGMKDDD